MSETAVLARIRPAVVIRPPGHRIQLGLAEYWAHRELLYFLVWRDLKVRYRQTVVGIAWAVLQPVMTMIVFSTFFGRLAGISSNGSPYPVFAFCALLPWQLFAHTLSESSSSLVGSQQLVTKVYFPRLIIPLATVFSGLADFLLSFVVLIGLLAYYGIAPTSATVVLPLFLLLALATAFAVGIWCSAMNVRYRDVRYTVPFVTQLWLFATPVVYPSTLVPEAWRMVYGLNPMAGVVEGFRWALLGGAPPSALLVAASAVIVSVLLVSGVYFFRRAEQTFADVI